jgi:hypothetical protein
LHPGLSIVLVKAGALTLYHGGDPTCAPHVVVAGSGFVDDVVRHDASVDAVFYVTSLVPKGTPRRIDEPSRGHCAFEGQTG